jgi:hypothetical protein
MMRRSKRKRRRLRRRRKWKSRGLRLGGLIEERDRGRGG